MQQRRCSEPFNHGRFRTAAFLSPAQPERKMKRIAMSNTSGTSNPAPMLDRRNVLKGAAATLAAGVVGAPRAVLAR
jgi:hypothetical protein